MRRWLVRLTWIATALAGASGLAFFVMKYLLKGGGEFAVIHHPLQPWMLRLHVVAAPILVFALGAVAATHFSFHWRSGTRAGRRTGILLLSAAGLMALTGSAIQVVTGERTLAAVALSHFAIGALFVGAILAHWWGLRSVVAFFAAASLVASGPARAGEAPGPAAPAHAARAWPVMGTVFEAEAWAGDERACGRALEAAFAAVSRVDSLMSLYREDSELTRLNRRAGSGEITRLSEESAEVLAAALACARRTGGLFDPSVQPLVELWRGYADWQGEEIAPPPAAGVAAARALAGWEKVRFDPARREAALPARGMALDFGGIAKGYALDLARAGALGAGAASLRLDLGGQVLVAGPAPGGGPWRIAVRHPRGAPGPAAVVTLAGGSLAVSGDYERYVICEGERMSSIVDPRSGRPARGVASVAVCAATGMAADAWSTALFVAGPGEGSPLVAGASEELAALWIEPAPTGDASLGAATLARAAGAASSWELPPEGYFSSIVWAASQSGGQ